MSGYLPISTYGVVGNRETCALVGRHGSVDWLPVPSLDSASAFAAILDDDDGGRVRLQPTASFEATQRYRDRTAVLETTFETDSGTLTTTDFLPPITDETNPDRAFYRRVTCDDDPVEVAFAFEPRFDYARADTVLRVTDGGVLATAESTHPNPDRSAPSDGDDDSGTDDTQTAARDGRGGDDQYADGRDSDDQYADGRDSDDQYADGARRAFLSTPVRPDVVDGTARATFSLATDETAWFVLRYDDVPASESAAVPTPDVLPNPAASERRLRETLAFWRDWTHDCGGDETCPYAGPYHDLVVRSGIVLRMLAAHDTGAIAAAPTTSLPEDVGGVRNWDYRYNWIRDSAAVAQILYGLGHDAVGEQYHDWFMDLCAVDHPADLQPIQGLHGETDLTETELDHLEGYRGSRPVRIGNAASAQTQLDTYGELLLAIDETTHEEDGVSEDRWDDVATVVDYVCECWDEKGSGIWEMQTEPRHFTHSKLMCWLALDRGIDIAQRAGHDAPLSRWREHREEIRTAIEGRGYSHERESFVQTFDGDALDATSTLVPIMGFLPYDDGRVQNTLDAIVEELTTTDGLVRRYDTDDGLPGQDGAFLRASFWLVNALALSGRVAEAETYFEGVVEKCNALGLLAEEIDPATDDYLGNYPQAYSHVGLASSVLYLNYANDSDASASPLGVRLGSGGILDDR